MQDGNVRLHLWKESRVDHVRSVRRRRHIPSYGSALQMRSFLQPMAADVRRGAKYLQTLRTLEYSFVDSARFFLRPAARVLGV